MLTRLIFSHKRLVGAVWFSSFALLSVVLMFHRLTMSLRGILLYGFLPIIASGIAGGLWGEAILNCAKTSSVGRSLLRGIVVSGLAFVVFSLSFGLALPLVERGEWSLPQAGGLVMFTWTLGILLAGPIVVFGGALAGITLFWFRRRVLGE